MRHRKAITAIALTLLTSGSGGAEVRSGSARPLDPDGYAVLRVLLTEHWPVSYMPATRWVIQQETTVFTACADTLESVGREWLEAIRDFQEQNSEPQRVSAGQVLGKPYVVVTKALLDQALATPDETFRWKGFNRRYPNAGGYIQVSAVGFSRDRAKAVAYVGYHCGGLCGGGRMFFLERENGAWRPTPLIRCWWES